jgi:hypothetical protein
MRWKCDSERVAAPPPMARPQTRPPDTRIAGVPDLSACWEPAPTEDNPCPPQVCGETKEGAYLPFCSLVECLPRNARSLRLKSG